MAARCEKCGYHLEPTEEHLGHRGCLVCQRDAANERAADYDDVSLKLTKAWMELEMAGEKLAAAEQRAEEHREGANRAAAQLAIEAQRREAAEQRAEEAERASAIWEDKAIAQEQGWNSSIDDRDRLAAALRWVEWNEIGGVMRCPSCWSLKPDHGPCCKLAAALSTTPPESKGGD